MFEIILMFILLGLYFTGIPLLVVLLCNWLDNKKKLEKKLENEIDLQAIEEGKQDSGQPWEDVKKELDL